MGINNIIRERPEYQEVQQERREERTTQTSAGTIQIDIDPLMRMEQSTIEFWLLVTQTLLLLYIAWKL